MSHFSTSHFRSMISVNAHNNPGVGTTITHSYVLRKWNPREVKKLDLGH